MINQNSLITHFGKRETALKWLFFSFGYFILFVFLENPVYKTISLIGREHLILFTVFCIIYSLSMLVNLSYMRKNFHIKDMFFYYISFAMTSLFGFVATTLMPNKEIGDVTFFATIAHWIFGFGGIVVNTVSVLVFLLAFYKEKNSKPLKAIFWLGTGVCILDLLSFVLLSVMAKGNLQKSKNGFLEIIPMIVIYAVVYVINHTDLVSSRKERDEKELLIKSDNTNVFSSVCFASLCVAFVSFTLFAFVRNPVCYTISMTGTDYPIGFAVTSLSLTAAFTLNFIEMFRKNRYKNPVAWFLAMTGPFAIILCVIFPTKLDSQLDPVHSISALVFFFFIFAAFIMYYFHFGKDVKRRKFLIALSAILLCVLIAMLFLFVIFKQKYGRTGLTELIPIEMFFLCFLLENHTSYFKSDTHRITVSKV